MSNPNQPAEINLIKSSLEGMQRAEEFMKVLKMYLAFIYGLSLILSLQGSTVLHYRFGERYITWLSMVTTLIVFSLFTAIFIPVGPDRIVATNWGAIYAGVFALHWVLSKVRTARGVRWHSRNNGLPLITLVLPSPFRNEFALIYQVIEPLAVFIVGSVLFFSENNLGLWFMCMGIAMFVTVTLDLRQAKHALLDVIDSEIESSWQHEALQGAAPTGTEGYAIPGANRLSTRERLTIQNALQMLSPEERSMLHDSEPDPEVIVNARHPARARENAAEREQGGERDGAR